MISTGLQVAILGVGDIHVWGYILHHGGGVHRFIRRDITVDREVEKINLIAYKEMGHLISSRKTGVI